MNCAVAIATRPICVSSPVSMTSNQTRVSASQDLYQLLYQLTTVTGQQRYAAAADAALTFFLASTVAPESGLLPWGAHAQWDFRRETWARGASHSTLLATSCDCADDALLQQHIQCRNQVHRSSSRRCRMMLSGS